MEAGQEENLYQSTAKGVFALNSTGWIIIASGPVAGPGGGLDLRVKQVDCKCVGLCSKFRVISDVL